MEQPLSIYHCLLYSHLINGVCILHKWPKKHVYIVTGCAPRTWVSGVKGIPGMRSCINFLGFWRHTLDRHACSSRNGMVAQALYGEALPWSKVVLEGAPCPFAAALLRSHVGGCCCPKWWAYIYQQNVTHPLTIIGRSNIPTCVFSNSPIGAIRGTRQWRHSVSIDEGLKHHVVVPTGIGVVNTVLWG